ncbi:MULTISPECIES: glutamine-hydrolyzing carbamoyl-phosphate synthase small subunit [unclassified Oceanobacter]|uniref:glutamine-hydrolyzing carbamoyl-phosphate synthase small subunit n=1 Tax=unclassified Oceanobacter TaxID=2620260 RepID=UPI0026E345E0|nr:MULTISPECIES: glutamine-hydrolyzing carbamoyl-phosphate synthase small subunit [unclassified Oceanobacter]MDO6681380.1 glutamine-hydrolyzing carbamoyl-phosphate synthase small subunit [Oceanobacter sp. 5_MG-2023]MDP2505089.1 glutamine-hydrolyzing carbamoyl-phosphate synthase small subunit [Oceanobacter sp. 3_MG-2023]MDP2548213.1 glutamine-hydrolyzing carbamoyl-phosphate synthase small subunit [Oceanobacter sp. 4_MG-2023]
MSTPAILALEDGSLFKGTSIGALGTSVGEVVFNTSMTGYQEILTDPSYTNQIVTLTYPHIGSYGTNSEDVESAGIAAKGLIIRDLPLMASSFRSEQALDEYLRANNVVGLADIDTRRLTRILREKGSLNGCLIAAEDAWSDESQQQALTEAKAFPGLKGMDLAKEVTVSEPFQWTQTDWTLGEGYGEQSETRFKVVAYDFGVKYNILRLLAERGCELTVVPAQTSAADVLAMNPDGIFLSNGPGDPEPCTYAIEAIREILETDIPVFGICLGHQLLALASGATTLKMSHGHHGANHPVQDLATGKVMITSQNHGFAVDESSLPDNLKATHKSLFDGTLQGIARTDKPAFSFQGHPEASPGPRDVAPLFDHFIDLIETAKAKANG